MVYQFWLLELYVWKQKISKLAIPREIFMGNDMCYTHNSGEDVELYLSNNVIKNLRYYKTFYACCTISGKTIEYCGGHMDHTQIRPLPSPMHHTQIRPLPSPHN